MNNVRTQKKEQSNQFSSRELLPNSIDRNKEIILKQFFEVFLNFGDF